MIVEAKVRSKTAVKYLDLKEQRALRAFFKNPKYRGIVAVCMGCGLRIGEALKLRWEDIDFVNDILVVQKTSKQRGRVKRREIPMMAWVRHELAEWYQQSNHHNATDCVFHGFRTKIIEGKRRLIANPNKSIVRQKVDDKLKTFDKRLGAHMLRHTFAMNFIAQPNYDLIELRELLGHASVTTTEIYTHASQKQLRASLERVQHRTILERVKAHVFPAKRVAIIPMSNGDMNFHVGREKEIASLSELIEKRVNVFLEGNKGSGKSHLLENLKIKNAFRLDDMGQLKKVLGGMLLKLYGDGNKIDFSKEQEQQDDVPENSDFDTKTKIINLLTDQADIKKLVIKDSISNLVELLIRSTKKQEYSIIVDDVESVTAKGVKVLEKLGAHFHLICAARRVALTKASFLSNFQKVKLGNLSREETLHLCDLAGTRLKHKAEDFTDLKNYIYENTDGNPQSVLEMINRYEAEKVVTVEVSRRYRHNSALKDIDLSIPVIIALSSLMIVRYLGKELGGDDTGAWRLIGYAFMIFALFGRGLARLGKRKFA